jgi:hypothetical protein
MAGIQKTWIKRSEGKADRGRGLGARLSIVGIGAVEYAELARVRKSVVYAATIRTSNRMIDLYRSAI